MKIIDANLSWARSLTPINTVEKLIQHHPAHPTWGVSEIHNNHLSRGWVGAGYNYFIYRNGDIYEVRGKNQGAHAGSEWNRKSLGICFQGYLHNDSTGNATEMTNQQVKAGAWLNAKLIKEYNLTVDDVIGHKHVGSTACPGNLFRMDDLKTEVKKLLKKEGQQQDDTIHRVQIGAYSEWENASNAAEGAKEKGYEAYIGTRGDYYVVQIGAFGELKNATALADQAEGDGYEIYISTKPLEPAEQPEEKEAEPEPPPGEEEEEEEEEKGTPILGNPQATVSQAQKWAKDRGAHRRFINVAELYWKYGKNMGIRPEVLYAQAAKETAFGHYTGVVPPSHNNWAGIKIREGGPNSDPDAHEKFNSPEDGVRAHFNHICAYVGKNPIGEPHGRYHTVMTTSWAGSIRYVEELGARWAPASNYGESIIQDYLEGLLSTPEPEEEAPGKNLVEAIIETMKNLIELLKKFIKKEG